MGHINLRFFSPSNDAISQSDTIIRHPTSGACILHRLSQGDCGLKRKDEVCVIIKHAPLMISTPFAILCQHNVMESPKTCIVT